MKDLEIFSETHSINSWALLKVLTLKTAVLYPLFRGFLGSLNFIWLTYCHDTKFYCIWLKSPVCQLHFFTTFTYLCWDFAFFVSLDVKLLKKKSVRQQLKSNQIHSIIWSHDGVDTKTTICLLTRSLNGKNRDWKIPGIEVKNTLQVLKLKTRLALLVLKVLTLIPKSSLKVLELVIKGIDFNNFYPILRIWF